MQPFWRKKTTPRWLKIKTCVQMMAGKHFWECRDNFFLFFQILYIQEHWDLMGMAKEQIGCYHLKESSLSLKCLWREHAREARGSLFQWGNFSWPGGAGLGKSKNVPGRAGQRCVNVNFIRQKNTQINSVVYICSRFPSCVLLVLSWNKWKSKYRQVE